MNCDRCGRYIPLKAKACPRCDPAGSGVSDPAREERLVQVGQTIQSKHRRNTQAAIWVGLFTLAGLISVPFSKNHPAKSLFPSEVNLALFVLTIVALFVHAGWRLSRTPVREQREEWNRNLGELVKATLRILLFILMVLVAMSIKGKINC